MDSYLESPEIWPNVHHGLISEIQAVLNRQLRPRYCALVEDRVYISEENDPGRRVIIPDVSIQSVGHHSSLTVDADSTAQTSGLAVAEPIMVTTLLEEEIRESRLVIIDGSGKHVVTVIEVLSPANKVVGSRGRANYEAKRLEVLQSPAHIVEIDLLRDGMRIPMAERLPYHDYLVHVSRHADRPRGSVWPILLTQRLPAIPVPLSSPDPDVELDLGQILNSAYDRAGYDLIVDYRQPPRVPLAEPNASWVKARLLTKG